MIKRGNISVVSPVMAILQDHLLVPSRTICSACSRLSMCVSGSTENVVLKRRQLFLVNGFVLRQPHPGPSFPVFTYNHVVFTGYTIIYGKIPLQLRYN